MKIKTSNLTGPALDYAVASIEKMPKDALSVVNGHPVVLRTYWGEVTELRCEFSTNWAQGGPIIEREQITVEYQGWGGEDQWIGYIRHDEEIAGPTPLIAAMRCYVASRLGDEVDIPEELLDAARRA